MCPCSSQSSISGILPSTNVSVKTKFRDFGVLTASGKCGKLLEETLYQQSFPPQGYTLSKGVRRIVMNLSEYLKSELARRNLSVRKASDHIGISHVTLLRILSGETPNLETLNKLSEWTRTDLTFLLELLGYHVETDNREMERLARLVQYDPLYRRLFVLLERLGPGELEFAVEYLEYLTWRLAEQDEQRGGQESQLKSTSGDQGEAAELSQRAESSTDVSLRSEG